MNTHLTVRVTGPGELLASIPALIGFHPPSGSLVLISLTDNTFGLIVRADLPSADQYGQLVGQAVTPALVAEGTEVVAVVIDDDPHPDLVDELQRSGITLAGAYVVPAITAGARWRSHLDSTISGHLPDPQSTAAHVATVAHGAMIHDSRENIEALFRSDDGERIAHRASLIDAARGDWSTERGTHVVQQALRTSFDGDLAALADSEVADLAVALCDPVVRDACLATAIPADSPLAAAAFHLWCALTRALPAPERAEAAVLAAWAAFMRGDGATAQIALRTALDADPEHRLSRLLLQAIEHGIAPENLHRLASHDEIGLYHALDVGGRK